MDLRAIIKDLEGCPCGRKHHFDLETYEADRGLVHKVGEILENSHFPKKIYIVSDETAMRVSEGILASLDAAGFTYETKMSGIGDQTVHENIWYNKKIQQKIRS